MGLILTGCHDTRSLSASEQADKGKGQTMNTSAATNAHRIQFDAPSSSDYLNGGYGETIAQCSCGQYEYVSSQQEGHYWHWLHRTNTSARGAALLQILVNNPMPADWAEVEPSSVATLAPVAQLSGRYTCPTCMGNGSVLVGGGGFAGHFYSYGTSGSEVCPECSGSGRTERWAA